LFTTATIVTGLMRLSLHIALKRSIRSYHSYKLCVVSSNVQKNFHIQDKC
jgi:hypothetical protein